MHDEIFHFEIFKNFKNFIEILKYLKTPSLKYFMKFLIFIIKWLKTFKNMIKVYEVSRKYVMLFMHNNRLPLTGLLTYFVLPEKNREIFEIFQKYFTKYFTKYSTPKITWNFTSPIGTTLMETISVNSAHRPASALLVFFRFPLAAPLIWLFAPLSSDSAHILTLSSTTWTRPPASSSFSRQ